MKWSLFNWKKPVVSSGEPEDYQVVKNTVSQNERNITNINSQITNVNNQLMLVQNSNDRNSQTIESLENRVNRAEQSINNTVSINTTQTITGTKTISNTLTLTKTNGALALKPGTNQASFIEFYNSTTRIGYIGKASSATNHIQIAAQFENIVLETTAANRSVSINSSSLKLNNTTLETGTNIHAGYGGNTVKFIPNDNSTKTLQFYNSGASDTRRFNLLIPEPTQANNPATKNYVDTKEAAINSQITAINNRIVENNTILKRVYTFTPTSSTPRQLGQIYRYVLQITDLNNVSVLGISVNYQNQSNSNSKSQYWEVSYSLWNGGVNIQLTGDKTFYEQYNSTIGFNINFSQFEITVFYMENANREAEQRYQGRIVPLEEIFGGNNEN